MILLFYIFFFARTFLLSRRIGKSIKAKNGLLSLSILFAGISSVIFLVSLVFPSMKKNLNVHSSEILFYIGSGMILIGLIMSAVASLSMKESWRIGILENEKTQLITTGIYGFSRNPYFLSYDLVLVGMALSQLSPYLIFTVIVTVVLFHVMILKEEKYLEEMHREMYVLYRKKVRRYI